MFWHLLTTNPCFLPFPIQIFKVVKSSGSIGIIEVSQIFESMSSHEEDTSASYSGTNPPLDNDKIPPLE